MTRDEILKKIREEHANLAAAFADLPDAEMVVKPVVDWWTLKDVMGHVAMWRRVAIKFVDEYRSSGVPIPLGLQDDAAIDAYNKRGATIRRDWSLARVRAEFDSSFRDLIAAVEKLSDADLSKRLPAPWDEGNTLERLIAVNSYEHEPEHTAQITQWRKERATEN